ncbi:DUF2971 domain-containing protein [Sphingobacterium sp. Mn56C]|uniref:DUF2971 domain-containing protein n=1 Tax=Sphingobacterium sp. Mn56C TaxID=3395261 RepID=UPI003BE37EDC
MNNIQELNFPIVLYKYRGYEGENVIKNYNAKTLLNFELFASSPKNFNDPFDLSLPYVFSNDSFTLDNFINEYFELLDPKVLKGKKKEEILYDATRQYNFMKYNPEEFWNSRAELISSLDHDFYGVLSLAKNYDNILMWSHYSNFHKGYCIGFDTNLFFDLISKKYEEFGCKIGPVNYQLDYPEIDFTKQRDIKTSFVRCFTKHKCWEYESEYRLVLNNLPNEIISYPKEIIKEIYLGCKMTDLHCKEILEFIKSQNLANVKVYKMKMGYHSFCVEPKEIII